MLDSLKGLTDGARVGVGLAVGFFVGYADKVGDELGASVLAVGDKEL